MSLPRMIVCIVLAAVGCGSSPGHAAPLPPTGELDSGMPAVEQMLVCVDHNATNSPLLSGHDIAFTFFPNGSGATRCSADGVTMDGPRDSCLARVEQHSEYFKFVPDDPSDPSSVLVQRFEIRQDQLTPPGAFESFTLSIANGKCHRE